MAKKIPRKLTLTVVGMQYRVTLEVRLMIAARVKEYDSISCKLYREPTNEHDQNAIRVVISEGSYKNFHIGYLTRQVAEILAPVLDNKTTEIAQVELVEVDAREGEGEILVRLKTSLKLPVNRLNSVG